MHAVVTGCAGAHVGIHVIQAGSTILTWTASTLVDICRYIKRTQLHETVMCIYIITYMIHAVNVIFTRHQAMSSRTVAHETTRFACVHDKYVWMFINRQIGMSVERYKLERYKLIGMCECVRIVDNCVKSLVF